MPYPSHSSRASRCGLRADQRRSPPCLPGGAALWDALAGTTLLCREERSAALPSNLGFAAFLGVLAGGLRLKRGTTWGRNLFANRARRLTLLASHFEISLHRSTPPVFVPTRSARIPRHDFLALLFLLWMLKGLVAGPMPNAGSLIRALSMACRTEEFARLRQAGKLVRLETRSFPS